MDKRRIMIAVPTSHGGGAERVMVTLARHLAERFNISFVALVEAHADLLAEVGPNVEVINLGAKRVRAALPALFQTARSRNVELVFSTLDHLNLQLCATRTFFRAGTKLVVRPAVMRSQLSPAVRLAARALYRRADAVVAQSVAMSQDLAAGARVPAKKIFVLPNPLPRPATVRVERSGNFRKLELLAAGRLTPVKGFDMLIEAVATRPEIQLAIMGSGPAEAELRAQIRRLNLDDRVHLLGFVRTPLERMAAADAFVLSSREDAFPNVVLEALSVGTPVIATPQEGLKDFLEAIPGCTVAHGISAEHIGSAIDRWSAGSLRTVSQDALALHDPGAVALRLGELFHATLEGRSPKAREAQR